MLGWSVGNDDHEGLKRTSFVMFTGGEEDLAEGQEGNQASIATVS